MLLFSSRNTEFGLWSWSLLGLGQVFIVWNTLPRAGIVSMLSSSWFAGRQYMTVVDWWLCARYSARERVILWELICFRESYLCKKDSTDLAAGVTGFASRSKLDPFLFASPSLGLCRPAISKDEAFALYNDCLLGLPIGVDTINSFMMSCIASSMNLPWQP